jgi:hypothetical protein
MRTYSRSEAARKAALVRWSRENPAAAAARGQAGLLTKFEREADPEGELPAAERLRRARVLYRLHMLELARRSAAVRRAKSGGGQAE